MSGQIVYGNGLCSRMLHSLFIFGKVMKAFRNNFFISYKIVLDERCKWSFGVYTGSFFPKVYIPSLNYETGRYAY